MERFMIIVTIIIVTVILVTIITIITKRSILDVAAVLDPFLFTS